MHSSPGNGGWLSRDPQRWFDTLCLYWMTSWRKQISLLSWFSSLPYCSSYFLPSSHGPEPLLCPSSSQGMYNPQQLFSNLKKFLCLQEGISTSFSALLIFPYFHMTVPFFPNHLPKHHVDYKSVSFRQRLSQRKKQGKKSTENGFRCGIWGHDWSLYW